MTHLQETMRAENEHAGTRLGEILKVLRRHQIGKGLTPVKLREILEDLGPTYVKLGQSATTLSGGEAQRVKLASELQRKATGKTLFVLDEPTTGLHTHDVKKLLEVLQRIVDNGDTVIVIEHNLDVLKSADHLIDLGPEGGDEGGTIVAIGTPEQVAANEQSYTGRYLKRLLED